MNRLIITSIIDAGSTGSARLNLGNDERFAQEVARLAEADLRFLQGRLAEVGPDDGVILWSCQGHDPGAAFVASSPEDAAELVARFGSRTVAIDASTSRIFDRLERLRLAAAIDVSAHTAWTNSEHGHTGRQGIYGRRDIAKLIGAQCDEAVGSASYGYMTSRQHDGLAHLLADYLLSLCRMPGPA